jgi:hypothetical protein
MNIFYLSHNPAECARFHMDRHSTKMVLEYAQLLSTAHRVLDGTPTIDRGTATGRQRTTYILPDNRDDVLYRATHINHPSAIWCRVRESHYRWLFTLWIELMDEYTYRYGKNHACEKLIGALSKPPTNIEFGGGFDEPTPAMPDDVKVKGDSIKSYRNYYISNKQHLASWSGKINSRPIPNWFQ